MKLFEALGGWVATVPELDVKMRFGTHCYHHACLLYTSDAADDLQPV